MKRVFACVAVLFVIALSVGVASAQSEPQYAVGVVFEDANCNGLRDQGERGLGGIRVSNGRTSVKTDASGSYRIAVDDDTIISVVKPRNWQTKVDANNVPRFYYIHKPKGSPTMKYRGVDPTGPLPTSIDFPLYPHPEPNRFRVLFLGDTQVYNPQELVYLGHDIIEEIAGTDAAFVVPLGDLVGNDLSLFEPLVSVMAKIGVPCRYVKGNHDTNYDAAPDQKLCDESFERAFGPSHYSFDYGPVHFVVIHDPFFGQDKGYSAKLDDEQMEFLRDDLASIPRSQLVVLAMHIPIIELHNREQMYAMLQTHPNTFSISAHWHTQEHRFISQADGWNGPKPHHHLINTTTCGTWWGGELDEVGIPHTTMRDGAPNGYSIIAFDGARYSIRFKAARRPDNYQMNIYAPDVVEAAKVGETEVLVNVFAGSERSTVEMRLGDTGAWIPMLRTETQDPAYTSTREREDGLTPKPENKLEGASESPHIWKANLPKDVPAGTHLIHVRTTDMFGQTYCASRVITIRPQSP